ncbi:MAG: helix-turn-helix transcriptional regulator [Prevotella sp.]|nr:helix-turn-helix transcriptional regulator [Prevotella sp.]
MNKKLDYNYCKAGPVMEWMSRKWAVAVLLRIEESQNDDREASRGIRFSDLFRTIPHLSEKMLASTLNYLEHEGLIVRTEHDGKSPCVEYSLTTIGESFLREISYVIEWGQLHFDEIQKNREKKSSALL